MQGDDRVRHCAECKLNVYNLAALTNAEVEELLANREGRLCLRLYQRRDGTFLTQDCPAQFKVKIRRISRIAGAALAGAMTVAGAAAQTSTPNKLSAAVQHKEGILQLDITDEAGAAISNAQIRVYDSTWHEKLSAHSLDNGILKTSLPSGEYWLDITSPGFKKFRQSLTMSHDESVTIHLEVDMTLLQGGEMSGPGGFVEPEPLDLPTALIQPRLNVTPLPPASQKRSPKK